MLTPEEIIHHHGERGVVYVDAHPTSYTLRIEESDPTWAQHFRTQEGRVLTMLGERVLGIQHIGSTAVPGLPAKPIIDIDLTVVEPSDEAAYVPDLQRLGYVHWLTEPGWHEHRLLKQLSVPRVHLHVFGPDCPEVVRHRMFRDWLISNPRDRERYAEVKRAAAVRMAATGDADGELGFGMRYNRIKEPVIRGIYDRMFRAAGLLGEG